MAEHERCAQWEGKKSKMAPREANVGRNSRPSPNPGLAGGGTNTGIAREQDRMQTKPVSSKHAGQFAGK